MHWFRKLVQASIKEKTCIPGIGRAYSMLQLKICSKCQDEYLSINHNHKRDLRQNKTVFGRLPEQRSVGQDFFYHFFCGKKVIKSKNQIKPVRLGGYRWFVPRHSGQAAHDTWVHFKLSPVGEDTNRGGLPWAVSPPPTRSKAMRQLYIPPVDLFGS